MKKIFIIIGLIVLICSCLQNPEKSGTSYSIYNIINGNLPGESKAVWHIKEKESGKEKTDKTLRDEQAEIKGLIIIQRFELLQESSSNPLLNQKPSLEIDQGLKK